MGTDIHPVIELWNHSYWLTWAQLDFIPRDYWLFQIMGGPRYPREGYEGAQSKGLPEPCSRTAFDHDDYGDHSFSWAELPELKRFAQEYESWNYPVEAKKNAHLEAIIAAMERLEAGGEKVRLVWGYDS